MRGDRISRMTYASQVAANVALGYMTGGGNVSLEGTIGKVDQAAAQITNSRLAILRYYFDVNNDYVLRKLQNLLLPFRVRDWERRIGSDGRPRPVRTGGMRPGDAVIMVGWPLGLGSPVGS